MDNLQTIRKGIKKENITENRFFKQNLIPPLKVINDAYASIY